MDLVRVFETYCLNNSIEFRYGSKAHLNLIEGDIDDDKIYLLLFPVRRGNSTGNLGLKIKETNYSGNFFLLKGSNMDLHYFNERDQDEATSKFSVHIEPLINTFKLLGNYLACNEALDIVQWGNIDAVDVLDANKDGLWCNYQINQDE